MILAESFGERHGPEFPDIDRDWKPIAPVVHLGFCHFLPKYPIADSR
jgi:hypothetical protein